MKLDRQKFFDSRRHSSSTHQVQDEGVEQGHHCSGAHQPRCVAASRNQSSRRCGSDQFIADKMIERIAKEREFWDVIPTVLDLQCAWQLLLPSANPRANHTMRTLPPSVSSVYCQAHDEGIWSTAKQSMGIDDVTDPECQQLASLPVRTAVWDCDRRHAAPELRSWHRGQTRCR